MMQDKDNILVIYNMFSGKAIIEIFHLQHIKWEARQDRSQAIDFFYPSEASHTYILLKTK